MNLVGKSIKHKSFGNGIVTDVSDKIITIRFQDKDKKFIYPDAFEAFLVIKNKSIQNQIEKLIAAKKAETHLKKQIAQAERDRLYRLKNFKVVANSHTAFNIPPERIQRIRQDGTVFTGTYLSGYSRGKPRIPDRVKPNSVCLVTSCPKGKSEQARMVVGAFMVEEDFFGEDAHNGIIKLHPQYRLFVPTNKQFLFWENIGQDAPVRWGSIAFKYYSGDQMNEMLFRMLDLYGDDTQNERAKEFYNYFCEMNGLRSLIQTEEQSPVI